MGPLLQGNDGRGKMHRVHLDVKGAQRIRGIRAVGWRRGCDGGARYEWGVGDGLEGWGYSSLFLTRRRVGRLGGFGEVEAEGGGDSV